MEQDSAKNRVVLVKTDRVFKYTLSVQNLLFTRARVNNIIPSLF